MALGVLLIIHEMHLEHQKKYIKQNVQRKANLFRLEKVSLGFSSSGLKFLVLS